MVDTQPWTGRGSWCLGKKAAAPRPSLSLSLLPLLRLRPPSPGSPEPSQRDGIPQLYPLPPAREGEVNRPGQAWGEIPRPLPLGPTPLSSLISQRRPPAAPRAWGVASAGALEGEGGDREEMGGGWRLRTDPSLPEP